MTSATTDLVRVRIGRTAELQAAALDVRRRVYCEEFGKLSLSNLCDAFDEGAVYVTGWVGTECVAGLRLVVDGARFELEDYFDVSAARRECVCAEANRFAILPAWRHTRVGAALIEGAGMFLIALGFDRLLIVSTPANLRLYERLGFARLAGPAPYGVLRSQHVALCGELELIRERFAAKPLMGGELELGDLPERAGSALADDEIEYAPRCVRARTDPAARRGRAA
jgi:GNAT superfamily N-acetyltransferase